MRKSVTILLLLASLSVTGQSYKLFNAGSKKVFTTFPDAGVTYSLAFDSSVSSGPDSVFFPYRLAEQAFLPGENCIFWGGPECRHQTLPIWAGLKISVSETGIYRFFNLSGDTLLFNTGTIPGQISLLFQDHDCAWDFRLCGFLEDTAYRSPGSSDQFSFEQSVADCRQNPWPDQVFSGGFFSSGAEATGIVGQCNARCRTWPPNLWYDL
jgi:hypothetical protein